MLHKIFNCLVIFHFPGQPTKLNLPHPTLRANFMTGHTLVVLEKGNLTTGKEENHAWLFSTTFIR